MKKEYKAPMLKKVIMEVESPMMDGSENIYDAGDAKQNNTDFVEGETGTPETSKKFWDDEE